MNKGKEFEILVAQIESAIKEHPNISISLNVKLQTSYGKKRQIDVLLEDKRHRFTYRTVIECKNTKSKVSLNTVGAFKELVQSVSANQGIIVSKSGFQKGTFDSIKNTYILLYLLSKTSSFEDFLKVYNFNFYQLDHSSKSITVSYEKELDINHKLRWTTPLSIKGTNCALTLSEVAQNFLSKNETSIANRMMSDVEDPFKPQIVQGKIELNIRFPIPLYFIDNNSNSRVLGFSTQIETKLFIAPSKITSISEYNDVINKKSHALVFELEYENKTGTFIDRPSL